MAKLIYKNERGESLNFGEDAPFLITSIDGLGSPKNSITRSKSPFQDGVTISHSTLDERELILEGVIIANNSTEIQRCRRKLISVFNPKFAGELTIERAGEAKNIECVPELAPFFPSNMQEGYQLFSIQLLCPDPFFKDTVETKEDVAIWQPSFEFPLEILEGGIEMGYREPSLIVNIFNKGDVPCGMKIHFKALATVVNPSLFNINTREYFKINKTMERGEIITVTTHFQSKRVILNKNGVKVNAFNWIDLNSTFLQLDTGDNLFRYDTDDGVDNLEVSIYYSPMFLGV